MILIDAGPFVALNDRRDRWHHGCLEVSTGLPAGPFATTWPCISEAMYLLGRSDGFILQSELWRMIRRIPVQIVDLSPDEIMLTESLMARYQNFPMDLADATLVAVADLRGWRKVFTLDSHFFAYRLRDGGALEVILPTS